MSRVGRQQQPGCVVHITSRTQGHQPWFTEKLRPVIARIIVDGVTSASAALLAYAVMPNHIHVLLAQGPHSLGWTMQAILRRIALLVQRNHGVTGHVFERRFRSKACLDADYVRAAILYTHFNPVRAGLCASLAEYRWTSHPAYCAEDEVEGIDLHDVLSLFADADQRTRSELRMDYLGFTEWWRTHHLLGESHAVRPATAGGDRFFATRYAPAPRAPERLVAVDLRDRAIRLLALIAADCEMDFIRGAHVSRRASRVRRELIAALLSAGYRGCAIATYLRVSPSAVSRVSADLRWQRATPP